VKHEFRIIERSPQGVYENRVPAYKKLAQFESLCQMAEREARPPVWWLPANSTLSKWLDFNAVPNPSDQLAAVANFRAARHNRILSEAGVLLIELEKQRDLILSELADLTMKPVPLVPNRIFANPEQDMALLQLTFACRALDALKSTRLNGQIEQVLIHIEEAQTLIGLLRNSVSLLPQTYALAIAPEFYAMRTGEDPALLDQSLRLSRYIEFKRAAVAAFETPPYLSNFPAFFNGLIAEARSQMDDALSYSRLLPHENDISYYLFSGVNPKLAAEVDRFVTLAMDDPPAFLQNAIQFAFSLIPDCPRRLISEQSIGLTMIIRVIFDRLYEKWQLGQPSPLDETGLLARLGHLPIAVFDLPPHIPWPRKSIRKYFECDFLPGEPDVFLTCIGFHTNPIDMIFVMHESLCLIHRGALIKILQKDELTPRELARILGFDELFAFLIGLAIASDVPEFFRIASFLAQFVPRDSLSNAFEYASAAIAALFAYFGSLNVEEMEEATRLHPAPTE
jgi:hypothetical protein